MPCACPVPAMPCLPASLPALPADCNIPLTSLNLGLAGSAEQERRRSAEVRFAACQGCTRQHVKCTLASCTTWTGGPARPPRLHTVYCIGDVCGVALFNCWQHAPGGSGSVCTRVKRPPSLPPLMLTLGAEVAWCGVSSMPFCRGAQTGRISWRCVCKAGVCRLYLGLPGSTCSSPPPGSHPAPTRTLPGPYPAHTAYTQPYLHCVAAKRHHNLHL